MVFCFDVFGNYFVVEGVCEVKDGVDDGKVIK